MRSLSCEDVAEQLDLFAAGECAEDLTAAMTAHLAQCAACAQLHREAQQLQGLLDLRFQEPVRLERLRGRLAADDRRARQRIVFRRLALAASVLLIVGLTGWWIARPSGKVPDDIAAARRKARAQQHAKSELLRQKMAEVVALKDKMAELSVALVSTSDNLKAIERRLKAMEATGDPNIENEPEYQRLKRERDKARADQQKQADLKAVRAEIDEKSAALETISHKFEDIEARMAAGEDRHGADFYGDPEYTALQNELADAQPEWDRALEELDQVQKHFKDVVQRP